MTSPIRRKLVAGIVAAGVGVTAAGAAVNANFGTSPDATAATAGTTARAAKVVRLKDARIKFEINATDRDNGIQLFLDADEWKSIALFDPFGRNILTTTTSGAIAKQGGTELFLESAEPTIAQLPLAKLFRRFPEGKYRVRGTGLKGERIVGSAILTHTLPDAPQLVSPLETAGPQKPDDTTVVWKPVAAPAGSAIIGYQVLIVQPDTGLRAMPDVTLDVTMPPTATSLRVPPGFLRPNTEYEWEVLAIERTGNQTLSSATFRTAP